MADQIVLEWHKFFHDRWRRSENVQMMDVETLGVFIALLVQQMGKGDLPEDPAALMTLIGHRITEEQFSRVWNDKHLKDRFRPVDERWVVTGTKNKLEDGHWEPIERKSGRIHNRFLTKVTSLDEHTNALYRDGGKKGQEIKANKALEASLREQTQEKVFNFSEILNIMPRRKVKGAWDGWEQGKEQLKFVTSQEEFDDLLAATRVYAKQRRGEDNAYHISFYNWVTKEHHKYVPVKSIANPETSSLTEPAKTETPKYPPEWCWVEGAVMVLPTGDKPPWIVGRYASEADRARAARKYPDDDTKRRWWLGEEIPEPAITTPVIH